jgi:hypothetical protein
MDFAIRYGGGAILQIIRAGLPKRMEGFLFFSRIGNGDVLNLDPTTSRFSSAVPPLVGDKRK